MMAELDWIVMSADERARATVLNDDQAFLGARRIVLGDHAGQWVVPARMPVSYTHLTLPTILLG